MQDTILQYPHNQVVAGQSQNILALSLLLGLALVTNLAAAPVILFRRTRYIVNT